MGARLRARKSRPSPSGSITSRRMRSITGGRETILRLRKSRGAIDGVTASTRRFTDGFGKLGIILYEKVAHTIPRALGGTGSVILSRSCQASVSFSWLNTLWVVEDCLSNGRNTNEHLWVDTSAVMSAAAATLFFFLLMTGIAKADGHPDDGLRAFPDPPGGAGGGWTARRRHRGGADERRTRRQRDL